MKTSKFFTTLSAWVLGVFLCMGSVTAYAVDELGLFELEGNATENDGPGDDWETLLTAGSANVFTGVTADPAPVSIFDGGKKDIQDISSWSHKNGAVPDKGDLTNAYAAAYTYTGAGICDDGAGNEVDCMAMGAELVHENGDLIIYFGADRFTNVGDTFMGFWFFKELVSANMDGSFSGNHAAGDTLVLVNFPQANNAVPLIQVVVWDAMCSKADNNNPAPGECAAKNLRLVFGQEGAGAICSDDPGAEVQPACAITNDATEDSPWPYMSKDGFVNQFPFETFFEGGINLTNLIGGDGCFASFMAESRSSSSFTASLKDFVLDEFPLCSFEITKECVAGLNAADDLATIEFSGEIENTGSAALEIELEDTPVDTTVSNVFTAICIDNTIPAGCDAGDTVVLDDGGMNINLSLPLAMPTIVVPAGAVVRYEGHYTVEDPTLSALTFEDTVFAVSSSPLIEKQDTANCFAPNPTIEVTKSCAASLTGGDTFQAVITGAIENTGNVALEDVGLMDNVTVGSLSHTFSAWYESVNENGMQDMGEADFALGTDDMAVGDIVAYTGTDTATDQTSHADTITASGDYVVEMMVIETATDTAMASCALTLERELTITKECKGPNGDTDGVALVLIQDANMDQVVAVQITNEIVVANDPANPTDNENVDIVLTDTDAATLTVLTQPAGSTITCDAMTLQCTGILPVGESVTIRAQYLPTAPDAAGVADLRAQELAQFSNTASVNGEGVLSGTVVSMTDITATATCDLCPD